MDELITHLVSPFLSHPDQCEHNIIESKAAVLVEIKLHEEDKESFTDENKFSVQHILSLSTGNKKPVLNVVDEFTEAEEEEESSDSESSSSSSEEEAVETEQAEETNAEESENNEEE
ncbi:MAG: hypothetical protein CL916_11990 [Deltaproteobacteria bacterium]|nr:hypothetical protein [Deltaproteobacteria bacterium]